MGSFGDTWLRCSWCRRWGKCILDSGSAAPLTHVDGIGVLCGPCQDRACPPHYDYTWLLLGSRLISVGPTWLIASYAYPACVESGAPWITSVPPLVRDPSSAPSAASALPLPASTLQDSLELANELVVIAASVAGNQVAAPPGYGAGIQDAPSLPRSTLPSSPPASTDVRLRSSPPVPSYRVGCSKCRYSSRQCNRCRPITPANG
jgi:hypothetical protein